MFHPTYSGNRHTLHLRICRTASDVDQQLQKKPEGNHWKQKGQEWGGRWRLVINIIMTFNKEEREEGIVDENSSLRMQASETSNYRLLTDPRWIPIRTEMCSLVPGTMRDSISRRRSNAKRSTWKVLCTEGARRSKPGGRSWCSCVEGSSSILQILRERQDRGVSFSISISSISPLRKNKKLAGEREREREYERNAIVLSMRTWRK